MGKTYRREFKFSTTIDSGLAVLRNSRNQLYSIAECFLPAAREAEMSRAPTGALRLATPLSTVTIFKTFLENSLLCTPFSVFGFRKFFVTILEEIPMIHAIIWARMEKTFRLMISPELVGRSEKGRAECNKSNCNLHVLSS